MEYKPYEYQEYATRFIEENDVAAIFLECGLDSMLSEKCTFLVCTFIIKLACSFLQRCIHLFH